MFTPTSSFCTCGYLRNVPSPEPREYYENLLATNQENIDYEIAGAIYNTARLWAELAEHLMFAIEKEGLWTLDSALTKEYKSACLEEPDKFSALCMPDSASTSQG